jgi:hypothetical protein
MERLVAIRWPFALLDADFAALRGDPRYRDVAARIARNEPVVQRSSRAFVLSDPELLPEGIAHDPTDGTFYVGSIRKRKIVAVDSSGAARDFVPEGRDGFLAVLGLKVDAGRRHLWAATFASPNMKGYSPDKKGTAGLFQVDLASGALVKHVTLSEPGKVHLLNDLAVSAAGDVFVTDSEAGGVWTLRAGADRLEPLLPAGSFIYPNGIALSADGARLFIAHARGIAIVSPASRAVSALGAPAGVTTAGIDGLALHGRSLVVVQNGLGRARITQYYLNEALDRVEREEILESGNPLFEGIPTTGVVAQGALHYIANSGLLTFDQGQLAPGAVPRPAEVLKIPLGPAEPGR